MISFSFYELEQVHASLLALLSNNYISELLPQLPRIKYAKIRVFSDLYFPIYGKNLRYKYGSE